jgi:hypothetical protein
MDPAYLDILRRAHGHVIRDELDQAIAAYTEAIAMCPEEPLGYHCRSYAHLAKENNVEALEDYAASNRLIRGKRA